MGKTRAKETRPPEIIPRPKCKEEAIGLWRLRTRSQRLGLAFSPRLSTFDLSTQPYLLFCFLPLAFPQRIPLAFFGKAAEVGVGCMDRGAEP